MTRPSEAAGFSPRLSASSQATVGQRNQALSMLAEVRHHNKNLRFCRDAHKAGLIPQVGRSAPENPGVPREMIDQNPRHGNRHLRVCTRRSSRPSIWPEARHTRRSQSPRPHQRRIKYIRTVSSSNQNHAPSLGLKSIHLEQPRFNVCSRSFVTAAKSRTRWSQPHDSTMMKICKGRSSYPVRKDRERG